MSDTRYCGADGQQVQLAAEPGMSFEPCKNGNGENFEFIHKRASPLKALVCSKRAAKRGSTQLSGAHQEPARRSPIFVARRDQRTPSRLRRNWKTIDIQQPTTAIKKKRRVNTRRNLAGTRSRQIPHQQSTAAKPAHHFDIHAHP